MTRTVPTDRRLVEGGLTVPVPALVEVFGDHWPGEGAARAAECPRCGHVYTAAAPECPSLATARALLARRRYERPDAVPEWIRKALTAGAPKLARLRRRPAAAQAPAQGQAAENGELFDVEPFRTRPAAGGAYGGRWS